MTYTLDPPLPPTATPKDYHRLLFDPVDIPDKRIVGLLACQRASFRPFPLLSLMRFTFSLLVVFPIGFTDFVIR